MQKSRRLFFAFAAATALGATTLLTNRLRFGARFPEALDVAKRRIAEEALVVAHELRGTLVAHPVRRRRDVHFARQEHSARLEEPHALSELQG